MKKVLSGLLIILFSVSILFIVKDNSLAGNNDKNVFPNPKVFELKPDSDFTAKANCLVSGDTAYGKKSIGTLMLTGTISEGLTKDNLTAYYTEGDISVSFTYPDVYEIKKNTVDWVDDEDSWFIVADDAKEVCGKKLDKSIESGCFFIQTSTDGDTYDYAGEVRTDFFNKRPGFDNGIHTFKDEDLKNGLYVRIIIAYRMKIRTKDNKVKPDKYKEYKYVEKYEFFLSNESTSINLKNMDTSQLLSDNSTVKRGFYVDFDGFSGTVKVTKPSGTEVNAVDKQAFTEPGTYTITLTTAAGNNISKKITVTDGLKYTAVEPEIYETDEETGYKAKDDYKKKKTVLGTKSHTRIKIGCECNIGKHDSWTGYGISGSELYIYLSYNQDEKSSYDGWTFISDDTEKVNGEKIGKVGSGAVIVKTSDDGRNWKDLNKGSLANGLTNIDVSASYGTAGNIPLIQLSGEDLLNGKYVKIYYAYTVQNDKKVKKYLERYEFYICYDDMNAIAFHNLTISDDMFDEITDTEDGESVAMLKMSETMKNNDYTISGFQVDPFIVSNGKKFKINAEISYKLNGENIDEPVDKKFTEEGCYDITITSSIGTKKKVRIYVDKMSDEDVLAYYFGESFITGKRIYSDGSFPVFEGGISSYNLNEIDEYHKPITGRITNTTTGTFIPITKFDGQSDTLDTPGIYHAEFSTNYGDIPNKSGDIRTFDFYFEIIAEGTAPGPVINQDLLHKHSSGSISDAKCVYYGVKVNTAGVGNVILVFNSYEDALNKAIELELKKIVPDKNNSGCYYSPNSDDDKPYYETIEEAEAWANQNAKAAVERRFIDITNPSTYYTISSEEEDILDNLNDLHVAYDVFVFAEGQRELMIDSSRLPVVNDKPAYFVDPDGKINPKYTPYELKFVQDDYSIDSANIRISDSNGKNIDINYNENIPDQLKRAGFSTGEITISEENKYGDKTTYRAFYIEPDTNSTTYTIIYTVAGEEYKVDISQNSIPNEMIEAETFSLANIADAIDPYGLIKIEKSSGEVYFCMPSETIEDRWTTAGEYTITCINRLGYSYSYTLRLSSSNDLVIKIVDEDYAVIENYLFVGGDNNIELPEYEKTGFIFDGYLDIDRDETYTNALDLVGRKGEIYLQPQFTPISVKLVYVDENENEIETIDVLYGNTYSLKQYDPPEGYEFAGWKTDDTEIIENTITVNCLDEIRLSPIIVEPVEEIKEDPEATIETEETVVVETIVKEQETEPSESKEIIVVDKAEKPNKKGIGAIIIVGILGLVLIGGLIAIIVYQHEKIEDKGGHKDA